MLTQCFSVHFAGLFGLAEFSVCLRGKTNSEQKRKLKLNPSSSSAECLRVFKPVYVHKYANQHGQNNCFAGIHMGVSRALFVFLLGQRATVARRHALRVLHLAYKASGSDSTSSTCV